MRNLTVIETETVAAGVGVISGTAPAPQIFTFTAGNGGTYTGRGVSLEAAAPNSFAPSPDSNADTPQLLAGGQFFVGIDFDNVLEPYFEHPYGNDAGIWSDAKG